MFLQRARIAYLPVGQTVMPERLAVVRMVRHSTVLLAVDQTERLLAV